MSTRILCDGCGMVGPDCVPSVDVKCERGGWATLEYHTHFDHLGEEQEDLDLCPKCLTLIMEGIQKKNALMALIAKKIK